MPSQDTKKGAYPVPGATEKERLLRSHESSSAASHAAGPKPSPVEEVTDHDGQALLLYFVIMLVCAMGNKIFGRLEVYPMHNYPLFLNIVLTVIYIPVCWVYIIPVMMCTKGIITKEQTDIPKYKFAVMGAYDSISSLLGTLAVNYIKSSTLMVLVSQAAIPISMAISKISLNSKYTFAQYLGASVVMMGIVSVIVLPKLLLPVAAAPIGADGTAVSVESDTSWGQLCWLGVLVISTVPSVLSSVYKEKALGEVDVDVNYLNGWVAIFQTLIAIPLCLPTAQIQGLPLDAIPANLHGGWMCWMGVNTITEDYNPYGAPLDKCESAPLYVTAFIFFNVLYNFMTVVILKYGSANILWLASTILVPLSNAVFSMKIFPGSKPMTPFDVLGLVIIMSGLVIYRFSGALITLWNSIIGADIDLDAVRKEKIARRIKRLQERKQVMYMGLNQIENLQSLVDTRVLRAQMTTLVRDPRIIRENYLMSIGVPPSPQISMRGNYNGSPALMSPSPSMGQQQRQQQHHQHRAFELLGTEKRSNSLIGERTSGGPLHPSGSYGALDKTGYHQQHGAAAGAGAGGGLPPGGGTRSRSGSHQGSDASQCDQSAVGEGIASAEARRQQQQRMQRVRESSRENCDSGDLDV